MSRSPRIAGFHGSYGQSRFDTAENLFASGSTRRPAGSARSGTGRREARRHHHAHASRSPSTARWSRRARLEGAGLSVGMRVFHQKFGYGRIAQVDGNKLTVDFDKAGQKKVVDSFVERC